MKLATLRIGGGTTAAWQDGDSYRALPWRDVGALLAAGGLVNLPVGGAVIATVEDADHAPLIPRPAKIFCVGMNYCTHIAELGVPPPKCPTLFSKFHTALAGSADAIAPFAMSRAIDWEAELVVVIGKTVARATAAEAEAAIAGYAVGNDISARDLQLRTDQWLAGKTLDATTPLGPCLVTVDEVGVRPDLAIRCMVNETVVQEARTGDLLFAPVDLIVDISSFCTLEPGDVIFTGTPGGIGAARKPQWFLKPGDLLHTEIEGIGRCVNRLSPAFDKARLAADYPNLDQETIERLAEYAAEPPMDMDQISVTEARQIADAYLDDCGSRWTAPAVPFVVEAIGEDCEAWIYRPQAMQGDAPFLLWLHGGGWVFGSARLHCPWAQEIASRTACPVIDLDYPHAPEHDLPTIVAACVAAIRSLSLRYPAARFILCGESAGATLALLAAADVHDSLTGLIVINPLIDLDSDLPRHPSRCTFNDQRLMQSWDEVRWFLAKLLHDGSPPFSLADRLKDAALPPTEMILGEYDLLHDEGQQFAASVRRTNVTVESIRGAIHNSLEFGATSAAGFAMFDAIEKAVARIDALSREL